MTARSIVIGVAALVATLLALGACDHARLREPSATTATDTLPRATVEPSIYALALPLTDQDGRAGALADLRGRVLVAAMMYSNCKTVCPRVTEDMKRIQDALDGTDRDRVEFALFSLDAGRDSPAALRRYARSHGLDPARWRLFVASEDGVRDLAAVLGVKFRTEANGEIAHSAMIFVIDREGVVRHRQVGVNQEPRELLAAVAAASR